MEIVIISFISFLTAILTFFSGFGLGTILTPVFFIFFPVDTAIALTGVVHFINNLLKIILTRRNADKDVLLRFGITAIAAAFLGSYLLLHIVDLKPVYSYILYGKQYQITPVKLIIAFLLLIFALLDLAPVLNKINFSKKLLPLGGFLSGFFGGLSGHQGAFRSAFLIRLNLTKEAFISTTAFASALVDFTRLSVYTTRFTTSGLSENLALLLAATTAALLGTIAGTKLLKKITIKFIQTTVAVMLIIISLLLGAGII